MTRTLLLTMLLTLLSGGRALTCLPAVSDSVDADGEPSPRLATDLLVVGGVTAWYATVNPSVRRGFYSEGSFGEVWTNIRSPIRRMLEGGREDNDPFVTNYVAHPASWGLLGLYLKERGYSNLSALRLGASCSSVAGFSEGNRLSCSWDPSIA